MRRDLIQRLNEAARLVTSHEPEERLWSRAWAVVRTLSGRHCPAKCSNVVDIILYPHLVRHNQHTKRWIEGVIVGPHRTSESCLETGVELCHPRHAMSGAESARKQKDQTYLLVDQKQHSLMQASNNPRLRHGHAHVSVGR
jgi:hypothetical protein